MKIHYLIVVSFLFVHSAFSQDKKTTESNESLRFSLKEAQDYAASNNLSVKNALLDLESAKKKIWETTAVGLPQVNSNGNYQYIFSVPSFSFPFTKLSEDYYQYNPETGFGTTSRITVAGENIYLNDTAGVKINMGVQSNLTWDVSVSQLIFSGEYIIGLQASRVFKELSEKAVEKARFDTRETVSKAYYLVLVSEENLKILKKSRELLEQSLKDISAMNEQGFSEETDVDQIRINNLNMVNMINNVSDQIQVASRLLKFQMGIDLSQNVILTDSLSGLIAQGNLRLITSGEFELEKNVDYQMMKTQENLSLLSLKREKSKFLPSVNAVYKHQQQVRSASFSFFMPDVFAVGISLPLFSSGMRVAKVQQAELAYEKSSNTRIMAEQSLLIDYQQSVSSYNKALNDYLNLKENIGLAEKVYKKTLTKFTQGMASSLELTQAQTQFLNVESSFYSSILSLLNAQAKLQKLLQTE